MVYIATALAACLWALLRKWPAVLALVLAAYVTTAVFAVALLNRS